MRKFEVSSIYELAEQIKSATNELSRPKLPALDVWMGLYGTRQQLEKFSIDQHSLVTSRRLAANAVAKVDAWIREYINGPDGNYDQDKLGRELSSWQYSGIRDDFEQFRTVFLAEVRDLDVYRIDQITIFRVSELVNSGSRVVPEPFYSKLNQDVVSELDSAAKALAFELHTACGFHSLRALEIVLVDYLCQYGAPRRKLKNWGQCLIQAKALIEAGKDKKTPSVRVIAMIERMKDLDRNPLMHPEDTLDEASAVNVFMNTATTIVELLRDSSVEERLGEMNSAIAALLSAPTTVGHHDG